jgi:hypothetical protein
MLVSCGEKVSLCMLLHAHRGDFNMAPCMACGGKHSHYTEIGVEKRCFTRKQLFSFAVLWCPANRTHHIKRKTAETTKFVCLSFGQNFSVLKFLLAESATTRLQSASDA